jgi:hypothetical protein
MAETSEVRIVDAVTGGEKGQKLARFDLMPPEALWCVAEVFGRGAKKYADRNWEKGYKWGLSFGALQRHLMLWQLGEDIDEETGSYHLAQVAWHALVLLTFYLRNLGTDDVRSKATREGRLLPASERKSS